VGSHVIVARWSIGNLSDPLVLAAISVVFTLMAVTAASLPARRAASIHPSSALRSE
jgi:ABC-type lipoprotein release transport system permease subunit